MSEQIGILKLRNFAREKLANHLSTTPQEISLLSETNIKTDADLGYLGKHYDIKASNPVITQKIKKSLVWDFDMRGNAWENGRNRKQVKHSPTADFYLLIGMKDNAPEKIFLLPSAHVPLSHIRIAVSGKSKYYQYAI